jgi:pimeloyl-ACP methyl ester carboxylesterase
MPDLVRPFRVDVPQADLDDLRARLSATRWPAPETVAGWSQGVPLNYLQELCGYWATTYDWRRAEARLNALPQFVTEIDGVDIQFVHVRSAHADALPLVLTHGWPGSVFEYLDVIEPLTSDFDVVIPSLPGYGFSGKPTETGWGIERIAAAWATLMARLGYARYGAHGSDWGTSVTTCLAQQDAAHLVGIHVSPPIVPPDPATFDDLTPDERRSLDELQIAQREGSGYTAQQATKPQTVGYALTDSPAGQCAWIVEKFWTWVDHDGRLEDVVSRDALLDNITLYWLTRSATSSARLYWESIAQVTRWFTEEVEDTVDVPVGATVFPHDVPRPSRRWAARRYIDIRYWSESARGGHFAALEQPAVFATELRAFFDLVR